MIAAERLCKDFRDLCRIESPSGAERPMADEILRRSQALGLVAQEDEAGQGIGGNSGNILLRMKGDSNKPSLLFCAHMDTVKPCYGKQVQEIDGRYVSSGDTILAADDYAGIAIIFELIQCIKEQNIPHGPLLFLFTVGEESGLSGSRNMHFDDLTADYAFVLDHCGKAGSFIASAPAHDRLSLKITGRAAHAGVEPEQGLSAIRVLVDTLSKLPMGRLDESTTSNWGTISGGQAMNIVCPEVTLVGEVRSSSLMRLDEEVERLRAAFKKAAEETSAQIDFVAERLYYPIQCLPDDPIYQLLAKAANNCRVLLNAEKSGGGSDASVLVAHGIPAVTLAVGYEKMHSVDEFLVIDEFVKAAEFALALVKQ